MWKILITTITIRYRLSAWNWLILMAQTKNWPSVTLKAELIQSLVFIQIVQTLLRQRKNIRIISFTVCRTRLLGISISTSTVRLTTIRLKRQMSRRNQLKQLSWTKTSAKQWTLPWTAQPILPSQMGKKQLARLFVTPWCLQHLSKLETRHLEK